MKYTILALLAISATLNTSTAVAEELLVGWDIFDDPVDNSAANKENPGFTGVLTTDGTVTRGGYGSLNTTYGDLDATTFQGVSDSSNGTSNTRVIMNSADDVATFSITNVSGNACALKQFAFDARTSDKFSGSGNNTATAYELWHPASSDLNSGADTMLDSLTITAQDEEFSLDISSLGVLESGETVVLHIVVADANNWTNSIDNIGVTGSATTSQPDEDFEDNKNAGALTDGAVVWSMFSDWGGTGHTATQDLTVNASAPANAFAPSSAVSLFYNDDDGSGANAVYLQTQTNDNSMGALNEETLTFSFDFLCQENGQTMRLLIGDATTLNRLNLEIFRPQGNVGQIYNGGVLVAATDGGNNWLDKNTWYRFLVKVDTVSDTYDLLIHEAGNVSARYNVTGLNILNGAGTDVDLGNITRMSLTTWDTGSGVEAYFDNFSIKRVDQGPIATGPNILFIIVDDLNDSVEGFGGHPQAITPNIDLLASRGVRFLNAACNAPLCAPSRPSMLTGLHPYTTKYIGNPEYTALNASGDPQYKEAWEYQVFIDSKTWVQYFREQGYDVYGAGKVDHNFAERVSDWTIDGVVEYGPKPSWGPFPYKGSGVRTSSNDLLNGVDGMNFQLAAPHSTMPKFKHLSYFVPLSDVPETPAWPTGQAAPAGYEGFLTEGFAGYTGWYMYNAPYNYVDENNRGPLPDELLAEYAEDFFEARAASGETKPFFMNIGINRPHEPWVAPDAYFDLYTEANLGEPLITFPLAGAPANDLDDCAPFLYKNFDTGNTTWVSGFGKYKNTIGADGSGDPDLLEEWTRAYLACVTFADAQIGRILDALEDPNGDGNTSDSLADNTIVVLTSDHGYHMGEKFYKFKNSAWEEGVRVPFIVAGPGVAQDAECTKPVSLIDLYPTFIELAGLTEATQPPQALDGHSIVPFLSDPVSGTWAGPDVSLTTLATQNLGNTGFTAPVITSTVQVAEGHIYSVRSEQYRYIICPDGSSELYDMIADPYAYVNQTDNSAFAAVKQSLHAQAEALVGRPLGVFFKSESYDVGYPRPQWYIDNSLSGSVDINSDSDSDGINNLLEFAFGTNAGVSDASSIGFGSGVTPGLPIPVQDSISANGVDFRAVFARRKEWEAAGLTYTVQFSPDLTEWVNSAETPTLLESGSGDIDAVYIEYPLIIETTEGFEKAQFFRLSISQD